MEKKTEFRLKTSVELKALTFEEREAYCSALLDELKRLHKEFVDLLPPSKRADKQQSTTL